MCVCLYDPHLHLLFGRTADGLFSRREQQCDDEDDDDDDDDETTASDGQQIGSRLDEAPPGNLK